jgi:hypothetical protein
MSQTTEVLPGIETLSAALAKEIALSEVTRITLAPGYLFAPGLADFWKTLEASDAAEIRLLTGNTAGLLTVEQRFVAQESDAGSIAPELDFAANARTERDRVRDEAARALRENLIRVPRTPENDAFLLAMARGIGANRIRVRVYAEGRLHTKAAIVEKSSGVVAFLGTTNITLPVAANPTQINLRISEEVAARELAQWIQMIWNDSQDFTRAFFDEISAHLTM